MSVFKIKAVQKRTRSGCPRFARLTWVKESNTPLTHTPKPKRAAKAPPEEAGCPILSHTLRKGGRAIHSKLYSQTQKSRESASSIETPRDPSNLAALCVFQIEASWFSPVKKGSNAEGASARGLSRHIYIYFSLLGGVSPFSRIYKASVAYCSLSCATFPHAIPSRERFA